MGHASSKSESAEKVDVLSDGTVDFNSFRILRSIGKGSFGKVCMVEKTDGKLFAMKYLNKAACIKRDFVDNVNQEIMILRRLHHDFIVNLWYTFQDEEDFFIVVDLLLGGDLRYHLSKHVVFGDDDVKLYAIEMASVLDYLKSKCIIHRDIKPENILLDEKGHAHLTDFNVAVCLKSQDSLANGFAGTKPYVAPEVCQSKLKMCKGYSYSVDWWSLAVTLYEVLRHKRPFQIDNDTTLEEAMYIYNDGKISFSSQWTQALIDLFLELFIVDGQKRLQSGNDLKLQPFFTGIIHDEINPTFVPSNKHLNYDPMHELEEMMIESKPLRKKKQRIKKHKESLKKQECLKSTDSAHNDYCGSEGGDSDAIFITFNRDKHDSKDEKDFPTDIPTVTDEVQ